MQIGGRRGRVSFQRRTEFIAQNHYKFKYKHVWPIAHCRRNYYGIPDVLKHCYFNSISKDFVGFNLLIWL